MHEYLIVSHEKSFRHAHIHLTAHELIRRMAEAVSEGFRVASSVLEVFLKAREEPIENPLETIRKIAEARQFSQKLTDQVVSSYLVEPEASRFGLINAFTNAARRSSDRFSESRLNGLWERCWKLRYNSSLW